MYMHKAVELIFERINIEQLKETPQSISVEVIHLGIQMTNNDKYIVYTGQIKNNTNMCIVQFIFYFWPFEIFSGFHCQFIQGH